MTRREQLIILLMVPLAFGQNYKHTSDECDVWNREAGFASSVAKHDAGAFAAFLHPGLELLKARISFCDGCRNTQASAVIRTLLFHAGRSQWRTQIEKVKRNFQSAISPRFGHEKPKGSLGWCCSMVAERLLFRRRMPKLSQSIWRKHQRFVQG